MESKDILKLLVAAGTIYATKKVLDLKKKKKYRPKMNDDKVREWEDYNDSLG